MALSKPIRGFNCSFTFPPLECPKCRHILRDPNIVDCCNKKNVCKPCTVKSQKCPECGKNAQHYPNDKLNEVILKFIVDCTNQCGWNGPLGEHDRHLNVGQKDKATWLDGCENVDIECAYCRRETKKRSILLRRIDYTFRPSKLECIYDLTKDEVCSKWIDVGLNLGLEYDDLKSIEEQLRGSPESCYKQMILEWIRAKDEASWRKLFCAFRKRDLKFNNLATRLEKGTVIFTSGHVTFRYVAVEVGLVLIFTECNNNYLLAIIRGLTCMGCGGIGTL